MKLGELRGIDANQILTADDVFDLLFEAGAALNDEDRASATSLEICVRLLDALRKQQIPKSCGESVRLLAEECGLFPYLDGVQQSLINQVVTEAHRVSLDKDIFLHAKQMEVLLLLLTGQSVILSGPTSFGKSLILDAFMSKTDPMAVAAILPTLALIDETRRRISRNFPQYQVVTTVDEEFDRSERVFFALTQERFVQRKDIGRLDLLFVDEFYKLDESRDDSRFEVLNLALYRGIPRSRQIFLAGPHISGISFGDRWRGRFNFISTDYRTVAVNIINRSNVDDRDEAFLSDLKSVGAESSLVFAASPPSAYRIAELISSANISFACDESRLVADWLRENYHREWGLANAVELGIGLHHGRIPRAVGQLLIKLFDAGVLKILICTSTLIEGVNTAAANVFIYDKKINQTDFDFFSFSNIKGRVGRMMRHFVGNAFLYHDPPSDVETEVDIPIFSQEGPSSEYLLLNIEDNDLTDKKIAEKQAAIDRTDIPLKILREHSYIGLDTLIDLDLRIKKELGDGSQLIWSGLPDQEEMIAIASLALFIAHKKRQPTGVHTKKQVAWAWSQLMMSKDLGSFISWFSDTFAEDAVDGIDRCFQFLQACEFAFPRAIAVSESIVNLRAGGDTANYSYFVYQIEKWFRPAWIKALDEMGVPVPLSERYVSEIPEDAPKNIALIKLAELDAGGRLPGNDGRLYKLAFSYGDAARLDQSPRSP